MDKNLVTQIGNTVKNWWVLLLVGVLLIILSVVVFMNPVANLLTLATFFSAMLVISGIASAWFSFQNRDALNGWGWNFGGGVLELVLGMVLLSHPGVTMVIMTFLLGFWLIFRGVYLISLAFEMRDYQLPNWGWVLFGGIITAVLAVIVILNPFAGAAAISVWISLGLLTAGLFTVFMSLMLRKAKGRLGDLRERVQERMEG